MFALLGTACGNKEEEPVEEVQTETTEAVEESASMQSDIDGLKSLADLYVAAVEKYYSKVENKGVDAASGLRKDYKDAEARYKDEANNLGAQYSSMSDSDKSYYDEVKSDVNSRVATVRESHADAVQMLMENGLE